MKNKIIISSILTIAMCFSLIAGSTFALFTSESKVNVAVNSATVSVTATPTAPVMGSTLGDHLGSATANGNTLTLKNFVPGDYATFKINVVNDSTVNVKYRTVITGEGELFSGLVVTIDENQFSGRAVTPWTLIGTEDGDATVEIKVALPESASNDFQNKSCTLTYKVEAVQGNSEGYAMVATSADLEAAIANGDENILLTNDILVTEDIAVSETVVINGNGKRLVRVNPTATVSDETPEIYTGSVFTVKAGETLTLENIVVDGGAVWTGEVNEVLGRGTVNSGVTATGALVNVGKNATIVLGEGAILQNNSGANAVNLGTRTGGKLIVNGGEIINNYSAAGAIWGGGEIVVNSGKINYNHGGIGGAIRAVTNIGTLLTMNGGEMNHNYSDGNGGAIWAGSSRSNNVYVLNGGEMAYNYSATTGGAIYAGYYETVKIGGTFKMHDNACSASIGAAIRFHDHASLVMTGGEVYNHADNAFFLNNNSASITGGKYEGNFGYSGGLGLTMGNATIDGVINYNLATNHNTAYLAAEFASFKFTVNESAANFAQFNFKPAADYTYVEGDEAKLVCMNEGYETYWDAATSTFRLRAK